MPHAGWSAPRQPRTKGPGPPRPGQGGKAPPSARGASAPGLDAGTLTIQGRGEEIEIGEFLREADREWLASAGNALLNG